MQEAMTADETVLIFYSSKTEPRLLDFYADSLAYLEESSIDVSIIDVEEDAETARKHDVAATPVVIVETDGDQHRYLGIVDGLKPVLEDDLYGKAILHQLGFKEGRRLAEQEEVAGAEEDVVSKVLEAYFESRDVEQFELTTFDAENRVARVIIIPADQQDSRSNWHGKLEEFLGGFFTEVFSTGVMGVETKCRKKGDDHCAFIVETRKEGSQNAGEKDT